MKKLVLLAAAAVGGVFFYRKRRSAKAESDLWAEATRHAGPALARWSPARGRSSTGRAPPLQGGG